MPSPATVTSHLHQQLLHTRVPSAPAPAPPPASSPPPPPPPISKTTPLTDSPGKQNYYYTQEATASVATTPSLAPDSSLTSIPIPSSAFSVASLPRTSSLIPPPPPPQLPPPPPPLGTASLGTITLGRGGHQSAAHIIPSGSVSSGAGVVPVPVPVPLLRKANANSIAAALGAGESERDPDLLFLNASNAPSFFTSAVRDPDILRTRRTSANHSRASSTGGHSEGFRNLNRWSASTTSSFASNANPPTNLTGNGSTSTNTAHRSSFARRMSIDAANLLHHHPFSGLHHSSPRNKLHKSRPSSSSGSPGRPTPSSTLPAASVKVRPPSSISPPKLAPIIALPSLEASVVQDKSALLASSIAASSAESEARGYYWDAPPEQSSNLASGPQGSQLLPAATITSSGVSGGGDKSNNSNNSNAMPDQNGDAKARGHVRQRSTNKTSSDSTSSKHKGRQQLSQKTMLSKALQRANLAVQLDNAQNSNGARESYAEACQLLQQVLQMTSGEDDQKKLEAIRQTYTSRIAELDEMLPAIPPTKPTPDNYQDPKPAPPVEDDAEQDTTVVEATTTTRIVQDSDENERQPRHPSAARSRNNSELRADSSFESGSLMDHYSLQSSFSKSLVKDPMLGHMAIQQPDLKYLPAPLASIRPLSPTKPSSPEPPVRSDFSVPTSRLAPDSAAARGHMRTTSHESISWLDPIDESGASAGSSVHSRSSSMGLRRKHIRQPSGDTEAEFDAALDAAVEAAYDDGYEPMDSMDAVDLQFDDDDEVISKALRKVELARERVREAAEMSQEREKRFNEIPGGVFYDGHDSEDEERILDDITRGMPGDDFAYGRQGSQPLPRESDSSINTSRTWHTSVGSNPLTALSTVTEISPTSTFNKSLPPPPPPSAGLPAIPQDTTVNENSSSQNLQTRRLSGQNPRQLKIETQRLQTEPADQAQSAMAGMTYANAPWPSNQVSGPKTAGHAQKSSISNTPALWVPEEAPPPTPPLVQADDGLPSRTASPSVSRPSLRKNFSSSSLRSLRGRNLSVSHGEDASDVSPSTPNNQYGTRIPAMPTIPTPLSAAFRTGTSSSMVGGPQLFDTINSPESPGSPNPLIPDAPTPLEPCPDDHMLRPFWLMRCLYQTLCHPRGGYVTNKLFVPRDVWRVKGTKLKNIDEKIAQCDYLTAALEKLAEVDTCDADAVLEEMQLMEGVLEQVQSALSRKLGSEVGVQSSSILFKEASDPGPDSAASVPRSVSVSGKSTSFSWRRLRSKNSGMGLNNTTYGTKPTSADAPKDGVTMASLPMTSHPTSRPTRRDLGAVKFTGPNAIYMASLARLFDATQTIDQIARQVEDPGLRHADKTQVGLELCTRHAAEFFGFYICRFVLADLSLLMDKFIKRGTEWVLDNRL